MNEMTTWTNNGHSCEVSHESYRSLAEYLWPVRLWLSGEGAWATVSRCGPAEHLTVQLHEDQQTAERAFRGELDGPSGFAPGGWCGGGCVRDHQLIRLQR